MYLAALSAGTTDLDQYLEILKFLLCSLTYWVCWIEFELMAFNHLTFSVALPHSERVSTFCFSFCPLLVYTPPESIYTWP